MKPPTSTVSTLMESPKCFWPKGEGGWDSRNDHFQREINFLCEFLVTGPMTIPDISEDSYMTKPWEHTSTSGTSDLISRLAHHLFSSWSSEGVR